MEERVEHPPIGSKAWLSFFYEDDNESRLAQSYVQFHTPVRVVHTDERGNWEWAVAFKDPAFDPGDEFWADVFPTRREAVAFAQVWNTTKPKHSK